MSTLSSPSSIPAESMQPARPQCGYYSYTKKNGRAVIRLPLNIETHMRASTVLGGRKEITTAAFKLRIPRSLSAGPPRCRQMHGNHLPQCLSHQADLIQGAGGTHPSFNARAARFASHPHLVTRWTRYDVEKRMSLDLRTLKTSSTFWRRPASAKASMGRGEPIATV